MPRRLRISTGGLAFHVLNRAVGRNLLFEDDADYQAMERIIERTCDRLPMRILSYCLMPNHWHLVLWPNKDGQLSEFMRLLTVTHTQRWHAHHHSAGTGPLYQGRFKSFPIQQDEHLLAVCRYVERNPLRANMVQSSQEWPWGSLAKRIAGQSQWLLRQKHWPVDVPSAWTRLVNQPLTGPEFDAVRLSLKRGCPYGEKRWQNQTAKRLALESTHRPRGRQRIHPEKDSRPL